jgi:hypothetical protein
MASGFDYSELNKLAADIGEVPDNSGPFLRSAIQFTATSVKKAWQEPLKGSSTLPGLPRAISYDIESNGKVLEAEIGFDKGGQGSLGGVSEFGTPTVAGRGFGLKALEANQADFEKGIEIAISDAMRKVGL